MAIVRLALPVASHSLFDYWLPPGLDVGPGSVVRVHLARRALIGVVVDRSATTDVAHDKLLERAHEIADIVNSNAPLAVRGTRLAIHKTLDLPLNEGEILAESFRERNLHTEDSLEGPRAFIEKRAPNWKCR